MIRRSFVWRVALGAALLCGAVLLVFGTTTLHMLEQARLRDFDAELTRSAILTIRTAGHPEAWRQARGLLEKDADAASLGQANASALLVLDNGGRAMWLSPNWPQGLPIDAFPLPPERPDPQRPRPPSRPDPRGAPRVNSPRGLPMLPEEDLELLDAPLLSSVNTDGSIWRVVVVRNRYITLAIAADQDHVMGDLLELRDAFLLALPLALVLVAVGSWLLARSALKPIRKISQAMTRITASGLGQRLEETRSDAEFAQLVQVFNTMMDGLERSFQQANRFSADAAHELKTPLAILQGELEQALQHAPSGSEQQQVYSRLLSEVQRLKGITRKLLLLSLADSGELRVNHTPVNLSEVLGEMCEDIELLAPEVELELRIEPDVSVPADRDLIRQVLQNLITNAVRYNHPDGLIRVILEADGKVARCRVANSGEPIAPKDRERIFDRFYRADTARDRSNEGFGLGLSLSREIARAHGGEIELLADEELVTFQFWLPLAAGSSRIAGR